jgi:hypothetical protein
VATLDRHWLRHQVLIIENVINCPFKNVATGFQNSLALILNPIKLLLLSFMWIVNNSKEHLVIVIYRLVSTFLASNYSAFTFSIKNTASSKFTNILHTIHFIRVAGGLVRVFIMWRANLPFIVHIMMGLSHC